MLETLFQGEMLWFSLPAMLGTGVFLIRLLLILVGGADSDAGGDFGDGEVDFGDGDLGGGDHDSSGHAFEVLSVQSISVFMMGFGWVGIGCVLGAGWSLGVGLGAGVLSGVVMIWILARSLGAMRQLESSGNVSIQGTLGLEGEVYTRIPPGGQGRGQVQLIVGSHQRMYNAVSEDTEITTRTRVRVVSVNSDNTLTVQAV